MNCRSRLTFLNHSIDQKGFAMKSHIAVVLIAFTLVPLSLNCGKDNTPYTNAGILRKQGNESPPEGTKGNPSQSYHELQQVNEKIKSMNKSDLFQYALDCGNQGKYSEALAAYNRILETDKNYPDLYYQLGLLHRDMGMIDEAICAFQTALTQNPDSPEAHYNLGYAYRCKGLHSDAITEYKKSLELISENRTKQKATIHYNLGFSYFSRGLIDDAITEFNNALAYKPKDKEIHQKLGIAYTSKGWLDKAKEEFSLYREQDEPYKIIP